MHRPVRRHARGRMHDTRTCHLHRYRGWKRCQSEHVMSGHAAVDRVTSAAFQRWHGSRILMKHRLENGQRALYWYRFPSGAAHVWPFSDVPLMPLVEARREGGVAILSLVCHTTSLPHLQALESCIDGGTALKVIDHHRTQKKAWRCRDRAHCRGVVCCRLLGACGQQAWACSAMEWSTQ